VIYRRMGQTGLKVSEIALGSWLTYGGAVGEETAVACIRAALEQGINYFDSANAYARGAAEEMLGRALAGVPRADYVLATKAYWPQSDKPNDRGLSRKHIFDQVEKSLRRLRTDFVDIFYCHRYDTETRLEETLRALDDLVTQGKVLYYGISEWSAAQIADGVHTARACNLDPIAVDQPNYSLLHRHIEAEIMPLCAREGIGIAVFSPLAQGLLTGKYRAGAAAPEGSRGAHPQAGRPLQSLLANEDLMRKVEALRGVAEAAGIPMARMALAWILRRPEITCAIVGASRPEQVTENAAASGVKLDPSTQDAIEAALA
jgi:L-glyceraldehyde 3-phosphate reductase